MRVGLRPDSASRRKAEAAGLRVVDAATAAREADIIMMLVPDEQGAEIYEHEIAPGLAKGKYLAFGHGFNIHFKKVVPPADVNVFMVAPKGPGHLVRSEYEKGRGVPCLIAIAAGSRAATRARSRSPRPRASAARARRRSRPPSRRRPRPISSASRPCCAAGSPS